MRNRRRRSIALAAMVGIALVVGGVYGLVVFQSRAQIEGAFTGALAEQSWPPEAPASLAVELASTRAMRRLGAGGLAGDSTFPDAGPASYPIAIDDIEGLRVRTGVAEGLYYIEAVFGDASFDDPMPMAVVIHGRGDRARIPGGPFWGLGAPLRVIVPQAPDPLGDGFEWLPVRVGSGLVDRLTTALVARAGELARFLRTLSRVRPTVGRAIVVGFSQGGILTFALAMHHTDVVQAAFPLAAWLPPALVPAYKRDDLTYPRIRGMHGTTDTIVPSFPTQELFLSLSDEGFQAELVLFEGVGHEMSDTMNQRLHAWLDEALGVVVEAGIRDGLLDGGVPPCPPPWAGSWPDGGGVPVGEWPDGGVPVGEWPDGGWPDGGVLDGSWPSGWPDGGAFAMPDGGALTVGPSWPCPEPPLLLDAGPADAALPAANDAGAPRGQARNGERRGRARRSQDD